jgi:hypothetical protein
VADDPSPRRTSARGTSPFEKGTSTAPFRLSEAAPSPFWRLGSIAKLERDASVDPILKRASECLSLVREGKALIAEIQALFPGRRAVSVEAFGLEENLNKRRAELLHLTPDTFEPEGRNGFTQPVLRSAGRQPVLDFVVLLKTSLRREPTDFSRNEEEFLDLSDSVRLLRAGETLFHELLHVVFMMEEGALDLSVDPVHVIRTGHESNALVHVDSRTLNLELEGDFQPEFRARLLRYVAEVIEGHGLRALHEAERKQFTKAPGLPAFPDFFPR